MENQWNDHKNEITIFVDHWDVRSPVQDLGPTGPGCCPRTRPRILSQTLIIHVVRTSKVPFLQGGAAVPPIFPAMAVMAVGLAFPYSRLGAAVGRGTIPPAYFPWLVATLVGYCIPTQGVKRWFLWRSNAWL